MNLIDMRTVIVSYIISNAICLLVIAALWYQSRRQFAGLGFWLADFILQFMALVLNSMRGFAPNFLTMVVSNSMIIGGTILLFIGLEQFVDRRGTQIHNAIFLIIFIGIHSWFTLVDPNLDVRSINLSVGLLVTCSQCAWLLLLRRAGSDIHSIARLAGIIFSFYCLFSVVRIFIDLAIPTGENFFRSNVYDTTVVMVYQMLFIALTFSLVLLVNRRLVGGLEHDISERQQMETSLRLSEEKFFKAFQSSPDAVIITRAKDGKMIEVNDGFMELSGYSRQEALSSSSIDLKIWAKPQDRETGLADLQSNLSIRNREYDFRTKTGRILHCLFSGEIIYLNDEMHIMSVIRDITARKQMETALSESEKRYRSLFENMLDGYAYCKMIYVDGQPQDFIYLSTNEAFEKLTGLSNVLGKRVTEILPDIHTTDQNLFEIYGRVAITGKSEKFETFIESLGIWFAIAVYSPEPEHFVAVFENISERKHMEASLHHQNNILTTLHQTALDLVNRHEIDDILQALLPKIGELLAAPDVSIDLLEEKTTLVTYAATPGQPLQKGDTMRQGEGGWLSWQAIETGQISSLEDYSTWKDRRALHEGHPIYAIAIVPIHLHEQVIGTINFSRREKARPFDETDFYIAKQLAHIVALILDNAQLYSQLQAELAERRQTEATLRQTQAQLIEQQRATAAFEERERLARDLHDGLGQILGFISIQSQVIQHSLASGQQETAAQLLARLTEVSQEAHLDLRNYLSGLKSNASAPRQDFFAALHQYCQHLLQTYGFKVNLRIPTEPPEVLASAAVETQLTYIIREALSNARRYSGVMEASVTINLSESDLEAIVEDLGIGIGDTPPYAGPERRKGAHFGLGIMRERAEQVGGSLFIETAPKAGTRIIARLPRKLASEEIPALRILLVDDHPLFLEGLNNLLSMRGIQVVGTAGDGLEAQVQARKLHPDLVLMDIQMPRCNGLEAARRIKLELPEIKIIMLSTSGDEENLFDALCNGASGYLLKGMDADEFLALLGDLARGETAFSPGLASKMLESFSLRQTKASEISKTIPISDNPIELTEKQIDILKLVSQGLSYKEIGAQLFVTERTIKYHMGEILTRLQLKSRREAADYAQSKGLT